MAADGRGHYKIFLGMAAGVGKTYRMLQEGQAERAAGRDVVIGYLEPHDRPDTAAQAAGLEELPRRIVTYRGVATDEMDLPAIFRRAPDLCLIDELAHANAPGLEHRKRHQDIDDVLDAGIDVFSTVNVQHLEALNDQVAELTGVRVRETFPDSVLASADEVVLVDLTPEALIGRLRAGKVYPPERVAQSLNSFFCVENLAALREVALRQVAEDVESRRIEPAGDVLGTRGDDERLGTRDDGEPLGRRDEGHGRAGAAAGAAGAGGPGPVRERILALVVPEPGGQRLLRRAWRSAQRLGAELDALYVAVPGRPPRGEAHERLEALRQLASTLGGGLIVEEGDDVAVTAARVARERGTTYVFVGQPAPRRGLRRLREPLPERLLRLLSGIDVRIVAGGPRQPDR